MVERNIKRTTIARRKVPQIVARLYEGSLMMTTFFLIILEGVEEGAKEVVVCAL